MIICLTINTNQKKRNLKRKRNEIKLMIMIKKAMKKTYIKVNNNNKKKI